MTVVRELISNAIIHRDYNSSASVQVRLTSDALEIHSPGGFPEHLTWEELIERPRSYPVDEAIVFYVANLLRAEGIGRGFSVFRNYLEEHGGDSIQCKVMPGPHPTVAIRVARQLYSSTVDGANSRSARKQKKGRPPRVFISYSHGTREHNDRVLELAQQLLRDGIDAELDQFHQHELVHWPRWCEEQLRPEKSDFVLCVCTVEYKQRIEGGINADVQKGVFWEGTLIYSYLYDEKTNQRFIPVLLDGATGSAIPSPLGGHTRFHLNAFDPRNPESDYAGLCRQLTGQSGVQKAGLGAIIKLPPLTERVRQTDFTELVEKILTEIGEVKQQT